MMIIFVLDFMMAMQRSTPMDCSVVPVGPHMLFAIFFQGVNA